MRIMPVAAATLRAVPQVPVRLLNPQPVIGPALGSVVTEYFSRSGQMMEQFPTARALDTYRIYGLQGGPDEPEPKAGTGTDTGTSGP